MKRFYYLLLLLSCFIAVHADDYTYYGKVGEVVSVSVPYGLQRTWRNSYARFKSWLWQPLDASACECVGTSYWYQADFKGLKPGWTKVRCYLVFTVDGYPDSYDQTFDIYFSGGAPTSVLLSSPSPIKIGQSVTLKPTLYPEGSETTFSWETSDKGVATVSGGRVTGVGEGDALITVRTANNLSASCRVTVYKPVPTSISIDQGSSIQQLLGDSRTLTYTVSPSDAIYTVSWESDASGIVEVNQSGLITAKKEGTANIKVTTDNGKSASCRVTVYKPVPTSISIDQGSSIQLLQGDSRTLTYTVSPSDAIYTVSWESDASGIVEVNQSGRITAKKEGTANVKVTTDNGKSASCRVKVPPVPTDLTVSPGEAEQIIGRTVKLSYQLSPSGAVARSVTWSAAPFGVCSVGQDGTVTALRPGTAIITATTDNGCSGTCVLTVPVPIYQLFVWMKTGEKTGFRFEQQPQFSLEGETVHFTTDATTFDIAKDELDKFTVEQVLPEHPKGIELPEELLVGLGRTTRLAYTLIPTNAQTEVSWFNTADSVAAISSTGIVSGLSVGNTKLTAQTSNGLRASCIVTVPQPQWKFYVWLRSGQIDGYILDEHPEVNIGEQLFILTAANARVEYKAEDVLRFTLNDSALGEPTGIDPVISDEDERQIDRDELSVTRLSPGSAVRVYDGAGRLVLHTTADAEGRATIRMEVLGSGLYIVKTEKATYKIFRR